MKVTVFGTGYVGLVQGAVLADVGHDVVCVDIDAAKVAALQAGQMPIHEPGLGPIVQGNQAAGRLRFTTDAAEGVAHGDLIFLAVGTPPDEDGSADLQHVLAVARTIATHPALGIPCGALVILTLPDGRKFAFRRADSGPYIAGRLVDARIPAVLRMGLPLDQGVYPVQVQWRKSAKRCLPAWVRSYDHLPACGAAR